VPNVFGQSGKAAIGIACPLLSGLEVIVMPRSPYPPFWINPQSAVGSGERSRVLWDTAQSLWPFTLQYCRNVLGEISSAAEILEHALERMERSQQRRQISEPAAYLRRTIVRAVRRELARRCKLQQLGEIAESIPAKLRVAEDDRVLAGQVLALVRDSMLDIVIRRLAGFSWIEIGAQRKEDPHALESRFSYEMRRIRRVLGIQPDI